jgi:hypothetical protein
MTNNYSNKSTDELLFIAADAKEAADCMKGLDYTAECKYLDQMNDAVTELYKRKQK